MACIARWTCSARAAAGIALCIEFSSASIRASPAAMRRVSSHAAHTLVDHMLAAHGDRHGKQYSWLQEQVMWLHLRLSSIITLHVGHCFHPSCLANLEGVIAVIWQLYSLRKKISDVKLICSSCTIQCHRYTQVQLTPGRQHNQG
jgi:hypothetical protein